MQEKDIIKQKIIEIQGKKIGLVWYWLISA